MSDVRDRFAALDLLDAPDQWDEIEERAAAQPLSRMPVQTTARWRGPALAAAVGVVVLLLGAPLWLLKLGPEPESEPVVVQPSIDASEVLEPESWNPILARTEASPAPTAATCPTFSMPKAEDPTRSPLVPYQGGWLPAVFDQHAGLVIYKDDERTWAFDVCTNTWTRLHDHPEDPHGWLGALVYDIDSDATISFGWNHLAVFDTDTNSWIKRAYPADDAGRPLASEADDSAISGVAYDPVSGFVLVSAVQDRLLRAYDVDTDTWIEIGIVPTHREQDYLNLLGYLPALDRLIVTTDASSATLLVDPRTGITSVISTPSPGYPLFTGFRGTFWQTAGSAIVDYRNFSLCEFSPQSLAWDDCYTDDDNFPSSLVTVEPDAIVEDTINDRLLFFGIPDYGAPSIWAHDPNTGQWTHVPFVISD